MDIKGVTTTQASKTATQSSGGDVQPVNAFADYLASASTSTTQAQYTAKLTSAFIRGMEKAAEDREDRPDPLLSAVTRPRTDDTRASRSDERAQRADDRDERYDESDDDGADIAEADDADDTTVEAEGDGEAVAADDVIDGEDAFALLVEEGGEDADAALLPVEDDAAASDDDMAAILALTASMAAAAPAPEAQQTAAVAPTTTVVAANAATQPQEADPAALLQAASPQVQETDAILKAPTSADQPALQAEQSRNPATLAAAQAAAKPQTAAKAQTTADPAAARQAEQLAKDLGSAAEGQTVKVQVQVATQGQAAQAAIQNQAQATTQADDGVSLFRANPLLQQNAINPATTADGAGQQTGGQSQGNAQQGNAQAQTTPGQQAATTAQTTAPLAGAEPANFRAMARAAASTGGTAPVSGESTGSSSSSSATASATTTTAGSGSASATATPGGQGLGLSARAEDAARTQQSQSSQQHSPATRAQAVEQVKVKIVQSAAGQDKMSIQLRPTDLGRVDIQLKVTNGHVTAQVTADSVDTLNMLKADSSGLQKALSDAGLNADSSSLNFSLRGEGNAQQFASSDQGSGRATSNPYASVSQTAEDDLSAALDLEAQRSSLAAARGGVDINV